MGALTLASLLFAVSFGLIPAYLTGVDSTLVAALRLGVSTLVFLPLLRPARVPSGLALRLVVLGAVQYGLMYVLYIESYSLLAGHEVALLTALTPLHVVLLDGLLRRRLEGRALAGAALAVTGAVVIAMRPWAEGGARGVLLVQGANLCFATGQVLYSRWARDTDLDHRSVFALLYLGAAALTMSLAAASGTLEQALELTGAQLLVLAYLALGASALGFFLWNVGAARVEAGTLAAFNNVKVPLAVLVSLLIFREEAQVPRLLAGSLLIAGGLSLTLARSPRRPCTP